MSFRSLADIKISKALNMLASKLVILEQNCLAFKDVFERVSSAQQGCIYLIKNTAKKVKL